MNSPLLWATRPVDQNAAWLAQLATLGETADIPLLAIVPVTSSEDKQAIQSLIMNLDQFSHVIFVSQNAVEWAFSWIHNFWPQLPEGVLYYAVGAKTAQAARAHGVEVIECGSAMNSEALLALPELSDIADQKILICRGKGGRPKLGEVLAERGARVSYCQLYERQLPANAAALCLQLTNDKRHIIAVFSGDTLQNLLQIMPSHLNKQDVQIVVPAQHLANIALAAGFSQVRVAQNASEAAMLATLRKCLIP
jgi:uroporphyrinogen-III synthase